MKTIEKLIKFINQKPGFESCNYSTWKSYRAEMREVTNYRADFYELLGFASRRIDDLETKVTEFLKRSSGRLTLTEDNNLQYITGQYFPTEYRPAACRVIRDLIWADYRDEKDKEGNQLYNDGNAMRCAAWHGGQWSTIYQFASSGIYLHENHLRYLKELQECREPEYYLHPGTISKNDDKTLLAAIKYFTNEGKKVSIVTDWKTHSIYGYQIPYVFYAEPAIYEKIISLRIAI